MNKETLKEILTEKPRSHAEAAKLLGLTRTAIEQFNYRHFNGLGSQKKNLVIYRMAMNLNKDIIDFFIDDKNFNHLKVKKIIDLKK